MLKTKVALAGNRTPVSRVAGEAMLVTSNSTTEPPMLTTETMRNNFPCTITYKILHSC